MQGMDVKKVKRNCSSAKEAEDELNEIGIRKGPWTLEEDTILVDYITTHGEGHWNTVARSAGVRRSGKSCRLRWLNYLRPDVRRGNITLQEQILILDLHSRWGNRWSKIAQQLPGRTDNEIKNYWRTRVIKQAKQLNCDVNSKQFRDTLRYVWLPHLIERVQPASQSLDPNVPNGNGLQSSVSGTEWVKPNHSLCNTNSGTGTSSSSDSLLSVEFPVNPSISDHIESSELLGQDGLAHKGSELWPSFNDSYLEQGNGGSDGDSLENLWNDHDSMWF